ncbi:MAG: serine/threonine-protein kinase [Polyangiaceae bacterium]
MTTPNPGDILVNKYRVERVLGEGGMGVVLAATHLQFETLVAIKLLHPQVANAAPEVLQRFQTEAKAVVRLKSEHVARVMDVGTLDTGEPFLVMEYLEGQDLSEMLEKRGPLPVDEAIAYMLQACDGVAAAHAQGIIHRDLKPANLFVSKGVDGLPCIKVLDFGIAKASGGSSFNMTSTAAVMGTPLYMSPEQMRSSKIVDVRSDVWSLGVILFQMLTGTIPFIGESMPELVLAVVQNPVPPISRPDVPLALAQVVEACLAKDPGQRIQSIGALARALAPFGDEDAPKTAARISRVLGESTSAAGGASSRASLPDGALPDLPTAPLPRTPAAQVTMPAPRTPAALRLDGPTDLNMGTLPSGRSSISTPVMVGGLRGSTLLALGVVALVGFGTLGYLLTRTRESAAAADPSLSPTATTSVTTTNASSTAAATVSASPSVTSTTDVPATAILGASSTAPSATAAATATAKTTPHTGTTAAPAKTSKGGGSSSSGFGDRQ